MEKEITDLIDFRPSALRYLVGGVTIVAAIGGLYYAYKNDKIQIKLLEKTEQYKRQSEELKRSEQNESDQSECEDKKIKTINKNDYEIKYKPSRFATATPCSIENL